MSSLESRQRDTSRSESRSPRRFARLRQTRVASLSPTPTLVSIRAAAGSVGGSARNRDSSIARQGERGRGYASAVARTRSKSRNAFSEHEPKHEHEPAPEPKRQNQDGREQEHAQQDTHQHNTSPSDLEKGGSGQEQQQKQQSDLHVKRFFMHFLGYRRSESELSERQRAIKPYPSIIPLFNHIPLAVESILWTLIGAFVGLSCVLLIFTRPHHFTSSIDVPPHTWQSPAIIGSFGASAVLLYAAPYSPMGQPRCLVFGQFFSALTGVAITKLIKLAGPPAYDLMLTDSSSSVVWVCGGLAAACAICVMMATGTLHPPGGATAVLCATSSEVERLGWRVIPVVLLSAVVMLVWTCIWMNLGKRRYPESFTTAVPALAKDGNIVQWIVDEYKRMHSARKQKMQSSSAPSNDDQRSSPAATLPPPISSQPNTAGTPTSKPSNGPTYHKNDEWQDESTWRARYEALEEEDNDAEAPVERPSRWDTSAKGINKMKQQ